MSINALEDKVIIKIAAVEEVTESGLYIPDSAAAMPETGTVVSVGPGRTAANGQIIPTGISVGDTVVFERRAAQRIEIEDEEYLVFLADHILAIVTDQ
jgi:chaperonin GroES